MTASYFILSVVVILCCDSKEVTEDLNCEYRILNDDPSSAMEDCKMMAKSTPLVWFSECQNRSDFEGLQRNVTVYKTAKCGHRLFYVRFYRNFTDEAVAENDLNFPRRQKSYSGCCWVQNNETSGLERASTAIGHFVNCTSTKSNECNRLLRTICIVCMQKISETSTLTTKVATLASPSVFTYSISGPIFLMIGFIVGFAILGVMLVSIFYQASLRATSYGRSYDPSASRSANNTAIPLKPIPKSGSLLLVPRNHAGPVDSVQQTVETEMPSYDAYKETKN